VEDKSDPLCRALLSSDGCVGCKSNVIGARGDGVNESIRIGPTIINPDMFHFLDHVSSIYTVGLRNRSGAEYQEWDKAQGTKWGKHVEREEMEGYRFGKGVIVPTKKQHLKYEETFELL
jgi:hypothetical protein